MASRINVDFGKIRDGERHSLDDLEEILGVSEETAQRIWRGPYAVTSKGHRTYALSMTAKNVRSLADLLHESHFLSDLFTSWKTSEVLAFNFFLEQGRPSYVTNFATSEREPLYIVKAVHVAELKTYLSSLLPGDSQQSRVVTPSLPPVQKKEPKPKIPKLSSGGGPKQRSPMSPPPIPKGPPQGYVALSTFAEAASVPLSFFMKILEREPLDYVVALGPRSVREYFYDTQQAVELSDYVGGHIESVVAKAKALLDEKFHVYKYDSWHTAYNPLVGQSFLSQYGLENHELDDFFEEVHGFGMNEYARQLQDEAKATKGTKSSSGKRSSSGARSSGTPPQRRQSPRAPSPPKPAPPSYETYATISVPGRGDVYFSNEGAVAVEEETGRDLREDPAFCSMLRNELSDALRDYSRRWPPAGSVTVSSELYEFTIDRGFVTGFQETDDF